MNSTTGQSDAVIRLFDRINYERKTDYTGNEFKLANMRRLAETLGNPERSCPVIHVAGTKGKGSVCSIVGAILTNAGIKTGVYTSPHLEKINQRIRIDGIDIEDDELTKTLEKIEPAVHQVDQWAVENKHKPLTFFEVTTAAALQFFSDQECEAIVLEVGMGGRLDSTNICQPTVCAITSISLDHTKQLGDTLDKIAAEKAGIVKPGIPLVCGETKPIAKNVIHQIAQSKNSTAVQFQEDFEIVENELATGQFQYKSKLAANEEFPVLKCSMLGKHQQKNAAIAIAICELLIRQGWPIETENIRRVIESISLPGRCEIVHHEPTIVLDMAHNAESAKALSDTLKTILAQKTLWSSKTLVFATSKDKQQEKLLEPLLPLFDKLVVTQFQNNPRRKAPSIIASCAESMAARHDLPILIDLNEDPVKAFQQWRESTDQNAMLCIAGSAFLIAELRPLTLKHMF